MSLPCRSSPSHFGSGAGGGRAAAGGGDWRPADPPLSGPAAGGRCGAPPGRAGSGRGAAAAGLPRADPDRGLRAPRGAPSSAARERGAAPHAGPPAGSSPAAVPRCHRCRPSPPPAPRPRLWLLRKPRSGRDGAAGAERTARGWRGAYGPGRAAPVPRAAGTAGPAGRGTAGCPGTAVPRGAGLARAVRSAHRGGPEPSGHWWPPPAGVTTLDASCPMALRKITPLYPLNDGPTRGVGKGALLQ